MTMNLHDFNTISADFPKIQSGWVWLVGAGPGDVSLLSLAGLSAIKQAEILVYDALVHETIINQASHDCQLVFAGKRGGKPSPKQQEICEKLIKYAHDNYKIVRLKGGDPFTFGRGGEECQYLARHHIPFRVIPGITAACAASAYSGIPITHRDINSSLTIITGHSLTGEIPDNIDWSALRHDHTTLVFYMAIKHFDYIADKLIQYGRRADEDVAVICRAAHSTQQKIIGKLKDAKELQKKSETPAIIIIGANVNLHETLNWQQFCDNDTSL